MNNVIKVSLAQVKTAKAPHILTTPSLGSCVAVMLYDPLTRIGSMAHIMLPDINLAKAKENKAKFANTAVAVMLKEMIDRGAVKRRIKARITGGSDMFQKVKHVDRVHIGARNIAAVKKELKKRKLRLAAEDTNGNYARSVEFYLATGIVCIKNAFYGNKEI